MKTWLFIALVRIQYFVFSMYSLILRNSSKSYSERLMRYSKMNKWQYKGFSYNLVHSLLSINTLEIYYKHWKLIWGNAKNKVWKTVVAPQSVYRDKEKVRIPKTEYLELAVSATFLVFFLFYYLLAHWRIKVRIKMGHAMA